MAAPTKAQFTSQRWFPSDYGRVQRNYFDQPAYDAASRLYKAEQSNAKPALEDLQRKLGTVSQGDYLDEVYKHYGIEGVQGELKRTGYRNTSGGYAGVGPEKYNLFHGQTATELPSGGYQLHAAPDNSSGLMEALQSVASPVSKAIGSVVDPVVQNVVAPVAETIMDPVQRAGKEFHRGLDEYIDEAMMVGMGAAMAPGLLAAYGPASGAAAPTIEMSAAGMAPSTSTIAGIDVGAIAGGAGQAAGAGTALAPIAPLAAPAAGATAAGIGAALPALAPVLPGLLASPINTGPTPPQPAPSSSSIAGIDVGEIAGSAGEAAGAGLGAAVVPPVVPAAGAGMGIGAGAMVPALAGAGVLAAGSQPTLAPETAPAIDPAAPYAPEAAAGGLLSGIGMTEALLAATLIPGLMNSGGTDAPETRTYATGDIPKPQLPDYGLLAGLGTGGPNMEMVEYAPGQRGARLRPEFASGLLNQFPMPQRYIPTPATPSGLFGQQQSPGVRAQSLLDMFPNMRTF